MPRARGVRQIRRGDVEVAVGYVRVSTDEQKLGPEAQRLGIQAWCSRHKIRLVSTCSDADGVSGSAMPTDRPGFNAALRAVHAHNAGWLVVLVRDRISREPHHAGHAETLVEQLGCRLVSTDEAPDVSVSPEALMMRSFRDIAAKLEKSSTQSRIRAALGVKRARGERVGSVPYGWVADREGPRRRGDAPARLVEQPEEQRAIQRILDLHNTGMSLRRIARVLEDEGLPCRGAQWYHVTVRRILVEALPPSP